MPVIGLLGSTPPDAYASSVAAFRLGLSSTGYVEGQNLTIEHRWAEDRLDRLPAMAADLVGRKVDLIVTIGGTAPALAAKNATPIIFIGASDPIGSGLVGQFRPPRRQPDRLHI